MTYIKKISLLLLSAIFIVVQVPLTVHAMVRSQLSSVVPSASAYDLFRNRLAYVKAYSLFKQAQTDAAGSNQINPIKKQLDILVENLEHLVALFGNNIAQRDAFLTDLSTLTLQLTDSENVSENHTQAHESLLERNQEILVRNNTIADKIRIELEALNVKELVDKVLALGITKRIEDVYNSSPYYKQSKPNSDSLSSADKEAINYIACEITKSLVTLIDTAYLCQISEKELLKIPKSELVISQKSSLLPEAKEELIQAVNNYQAPSHKDPTSAIARRSLLHWIKELDTKTVDIQSFDYIKNQITTNTQDAVKNITSFVKNLPGLQGSYQTRMNAGLKHEIIDKIESMSPILQNKIITNHPEWLEECDSTSSEFKIFKSKLEEMSFVYTCLPKLQEDIKLVIQQYGFTKTQISNKVASDIYQKIDKYLPGINKLAINNEIIQQAVEALTACLKSKDEQNLLGQLARYSISNADVLFYDTSASLLSTKTIRALVLDHLRQETENNKHSFVCHILRTMELQDPQDTFDVLVSMLDYYPTNCKRFIKSTKISACNKALFDYLKILIERYPQNITKNGLKGKYELNLKHATELEDYSKISGLHIWDFSKNSNAPIVENRWEFNCLDNGTLVVTLGINKEKILYCPDNLNIKIASISDRHFDISNEDALKTQKLAKDFLGSIEKRRQEPTSKCSTLFPDSLADNAKMLIKVGQALDALKAQGLESHTTAGDRKVKCIGVCREDAPNDHNKIYVEFIIDESTDRVVPSIITFYPLANFKQANPILVKNRQAFEPYAGKLNKDTLEMLKKSNIKAYQDLVINLMDDQEIEYQNSLKQLICNDIIEQLVQAASPSADITGETLSKVKPISNERIVALIFGVTQPQIQEISDYLKNYTKSRVDFKNEIKTASNESQQSSIAWVNSLLATLSIKNWANRQKQNSILYCYTMLNPQQPMACLKYLVSTKKEFKDSSTVLIVGCSFQTGTGHAWRISDKIKLLASHDSDYKINKLGAGFFYIPIKKQELLDALKRRQQSIN